MPPTWPMIQLLGNGRGQYGSTRNAGLWALAGKAAKIMAVSAAIKKVHQDFSMISSLVIRLSRPQNWMTWAAGGLQSFCILLRCTYRKAVLCHLWPGARQ